MKKVFGIINNYKWSFVILPIVVVLIVSIAMTYALPDKEIRLLTDSDIGYCTNVAQLAEEINPENLPNVIKAVTAPLTTSHDNVVVKRCLGVKGQEDVYHPIEQEKYYIDKKVNNVNAKNIEVFVTGNLIGMQVKLILDKAFEITIVEENNEIVIKIKNIKIEMRRFTRSNSLIIGRMRFNFFIRIS